MLIARLSSHTFRDAEALADSVFLYVGDLRNKRLIDAPCPRWTNHRESLGGKDRLAGDGPPEHRDPTPDERGDIHGTHTPDRGNPAGPEHERMVVPQETEGFEFPGKFRFGRYVCSCHCTFPADHELRFAGKKIALSVLSSRFARRGKQFPELLAPGE